MQARGTRKQAGGEWQFCRHSEIFAMIAKFSLYSEIFAMIAKFLYIAKFLCIAKFYATCFCDSNDSVLINSSFALNVIILFRIVWYFRMFVGLYKPCYEYLVT